MKKALVLWIIGIFGIVSLLLVTTGCQPQETTSPIVAPDPFTLSWSPQNQDYFVVFSGDSAGHSAGEQSEFILRLKNNMSEVFQGEYIIQLLDKNGIVMEIARDTFNVPGGLGPEIIIPVIFNEGLDGPYGLSLYMPTQGSQSVTTIWIGQKNTQTAGPWPGLASHPWLWPEQKPMTEEEARQTAEDFVKNSPTFVFDGIEESLELVETLYPDMENAWQFVFRFESRHGGYGDRTGQILTQVITPHEAVISLLDGAVVTAVLDGIWDMLGQHDAITIETAPIEEVDIVVMESYPEQIGIYIKGGLSDGCTTFHDLVVDRDGMTVTITVTTERPFGASCPAVYTTFEKNVNLGSDFERGATYTLNVNDYTTTFTYPD